MTETNTFMGNWKFKDIKLKELIDFGFPLPQFNLSIELKTYFDVTKFNEDGMQAITYDYRNFFVKNDVMTLIPEINKQLNLSLNTSLVNFRGFYKGNQSSYYAIGTIRDESNGFKNPLFVNLNYTCLSSTSKSCKIDGCRNEGYKDSPFGPQIHLEYPMKNEFYQY
jgi:hypothetical protein